MDASLSSGSEGEMCVETDVEMEAQSGDDGYVETDDHDDRRSIDEK